MATNAEKLEQAEAALHSLITGNKVRVFVDQNGERVEYTSANIAQLRAYIRELQALVNPTAAKSNWARPVGFTF